MIHHPRIVLSFVILFLFPLRVRVVRAFHVDPSLDAARKTFWKPIRDVDPSYVRHEDQMTLPYTDQDRKWRFPEQTLTRQPFDLAGASATSVLPSLTDQDRTWRDPLIQTLRRGQMVEPYNDEDRMWRQPSEELVRHVDDIPDELEDEDRFWWMKDGTEHLLLEDEVDDMQEGEVLLEEEGGEIPVVYQEAEATQRRLFRRPTSKFTRHPHSVNGDLDEETSLSTMQEDDRLGWLTENTNQLLLEDEIGFLGNDYLGTC